MDYFARSLSGLFGWQSWLPIWPAVTLVYLGGSHIGLFGKQSHWTAWPAVMAVQGPVWPAVLVDFFCQQSGWPILPAVLVAILACNLGGLFGQQLAYLAGSYIGLFGQQ